MSTNTTKADRAQITYDAMMSMDEEAHQLCHMVLVDDLPMDLASDLLGLEKEEAENILEESLEHLLTAIGEKGDSMSRSEVGELLFEAGRVKDVQVEPFYPPTEQTTPNLLRFPEAKDPVAPPKDVPKSNGSEGERETKRPKPTPLYLAAGWLAVSFLVLWLAPGTTFDIKSQGSWPVRSPLKLSEFEASGAGLNLAADECVRFGRVEGTREIELVVCAEEQGRETKDKCQRYLELKLVDTTTRSEQYAGPFTIGKYTADRIPTGLKFENDSHETTLYARWRQERREKRGCVKPTE